MRALALLLLGTLAGTASASSLVEPKLLTRDASPSVLVLHDKPATAATLTTLPARSHDANVAIGEVDPPHQPHPAVGSIDTFSPSMVAIGEPAVVDQKVGAIDHTPHRARTTMVIRGGEIGNAFSPPQPAAKASPDQPSSSSQANARPPYPYPVKLPKRSQPTPVKATTPPEPAPEAAASPPAASRRELQRSQ